MKLSRYNHYGHTIWSFIWSPQSDIPLPFRPLWLHKKLIIWLILWYLSPISALLCWTEQLSLVSLTLTNVLHQLRAICKFVKQQNLFPLPTLFTSLSSHNLWSLPSLVFTTQAPWINDNKYPWYKHHNSNISFNTKETVACSLHFVCGPLNQGQIWQRSGNC